MSWKLKIFLLRSRQYYGHPKEIELQPESRISLDMDGTHYPKLRSYPDGLEIEI